ncbi:MAG: hypothetical protein ACJA14_001357 [Ilumatobacter sp.]|jgi:hypothetical protein
MSATGPKLIVAGLFAAALTIPTPTSAPVEAEGPGVRLGPVETVCVEVPEAEPGDVALANVTIVNASDRGFATAHNEDVNPWSVSSINYSQGDTVPNLTATVVTPDRRICVTSSRAASAHVVVDLVGIIDGNRFNAADQGGERILDTRLSNGPTGGDKVAPNATVCVEANRSDRDVVAVVNSTVVKPSNAGFVTVRGSTTSTDRTTSSHNFAAGQTVAGLTMSFLSPGQELCASTSQSSAVHMLFDVVGWLDADAFTSSTGPTRVLDTRLDSGPTDGRPVEAGGTTCVDLQAGPGGLAIASVVIVRPDARGYATVHGGTQGAVSTHNFITDRNAANLAAVTLGADASLCATVAPSTSAHIVADLSGVIDSDAVVDMPAGTRRVLDTRVSTSLPGRYGASALQFESCDVLLKRFKLARLAELDRFGYVDGDVVIGPPIEIPTTNGNDPVSSPEFSDTNRQDADVDEGDLMETDGTYLYTSVVLDESQGFRTALQVIDIAAGTVAAQVDLAGVYPEMILHDNHLVTSTSGDAEDSYTQTTITVFDVSDPTSPQMVDRYGVDGTRVAMRSVGDRLRVVLNSYRSVGEQRLDGPITFGDLRAQVENSVIEDWLPRVFEVEADGSYGDERTGIDCDVIGIPNVDAGLGVTWVVEDILGSAAGPESAAGVAVRGGGSTVMASRTNLYVAVNTYVPWSPEAFLAGSTVTAIHLFETSANAPISYAASGEVPGQILNQFAMGEHDGVLRVAVTDGWWNESSSAVFALRRVGSSFERVSAVTDLAAGERIFAVRHMGATSYVVTFRETDPLFVIDFTDAARPVVQGELKIPGFSTYLHPVGPGLLLGVGQDADLDGRVIGAQLSLFDVSEPTNPRRIDTLNIDGWRGLNDHREFLFWGPTGTIAIPAVDDQSGVQSIAVARLEGRTLRSIGRFAAGEYPCAPDRTVLVGNELLAISRASTTIAHRDSLRVRASIVTGACGPV